MEQHGFLLKAVWAVPPVRLGRLGQREPPERQERLELPAQRVLPERQAELVRLGAPEQRGVLVLLDRPGQLVQPVEPV